MLQAKSVPRYLVKGVIVTAGRVIELYVFSRISMLRVSSSRRF